MSSQYGREGGGGGGGLHRTGHNQPPAQPPPQGPRLSPRREPARPQRRAAPLPCAEQRVGEGGAPRDLATPRP